MRTIRRTRAFKRDYRREKRGTYRLTLDGDLSAVISLLLNDSVLPDRCQDHPMRGARSTERNCHVHPDLVLLYRKPNESDLELVRLGSHSELGI